MGHCSTIARPERRTMEATHLTCTNPAVGSCRSFSGEETVIEQGAGFWASQADR
jgi:hypothetical protein